MSNVVERTGPGRLFRQPWFHVAAYVALIFTLSAQPNLHVPGTLAYRDKYVHMLEYGGLSWLVYSRGARFVAGSRRDPPCAAHACLRSPRSAACDEKFQAGTPGRDSSVYDWMADTAGASLAQVMSFALEKRREAA